MIDRRRLLIGAAAFTGAAVVIPRGVAVASAKVGSPAPPFTLPSSTGPAVTLGDLR